jgi:hypothetical protein
MTDRETLFDRCAEDRLNQNLMRMRQAKLVPTRKAYSWPEILLWGAVGAAALLAATGWL